ncbi:MAG: DNA mismatch repair protein MutS [Eubacterium sp.]|nr:DNA mismatch repair protein MutS [Eubacterium sp.]
MMDEYKNRVNLIDEELVTADRKYGLISFFRLVSFFAAVIAFYTGVTGGKTVLTLTGAVMAVLFIALLRVHAGLEEKRTCLRAEKEVIERYIARLSGEWRSFPDDGSEFLLKEDTLSRDLDLLGPASLYQLISVAHTEEGRRKTAETISLQNVEREEIDKRNEAVRELAGKKAFLIGFESVAARITKRRKHKEIEDYEEKTSLPFIVPVLMVLIPLINTAAVIAAVLKLIKPEMVLFSALGCLIITELFSSLRNNILYPIHVLGNSSRDYYALLKLVRDEDFKSDILSGIKERVSGKDGMISAIKRLQVISEADNISFNPIIHMILNGVIGWDFWLMKASDGWNKRFGGSVSECISCVADVEELCSLSVISVIGKTCNPKINYSAEDAKNGELLSVENVYHPLIGTEKAVSNTARITGGATVITGSNMSGKTTFLRTIAINMALSYMGAEACADRMELRYMKLFTSMRVMDDVAGGISTFYAEILRIKGMAEYISSDPEIPAACFIDEIFKGTNSADRIVGAENAILKLSRGKGFVIVSTHDFELCELKMSDGRTVMNYHFEEYYEDDELKFDYKLKDGRCTTRNAKTLLKMAGLMD